MLQTTSSWPRNLEVTTHRWTRLSEIQYIRGDREWMFEIEERDGQIQHRHQNTSIPVVDIEALHGTAFVSETMHQSSVRIPQTHDFIVRRCDPVAKVPNPTHLGIGSPIEERNVTYLTCVTSGASTSACSITCCRSSLPSRDDGYLSKPMVPSIVVRLAICMHSSHRGRQLDACG